MIASFVQPPFPWFGGKSRAADLIWSRLGNVANYIEPFAGSLAVMLARPTPPQTETVNDADRYIANFWRAVQHDPEAVAVAADWPVNETDLESRHLWLITEGKTQLAALMATPDGYCPKIAGWWAWGQCAWIGSGWCSGEGPWRVDGGQWLRNAGQGVNRQIPHLSNAGQGVNRKLPHLSNAGQGVWQRHRENLISYFGALADRLRYVRVCCGDWTRVLTPSVTFRHGLTGIVLDPPYGIGEVDYSAGGNKGTGIADAAREWAIANGDNPDLRIALCGYEGQHDMPDDWAVERWTAAGGYSSTAAGDTEGKANRHRETVWFSPNCVNPSKGTTLFELMGGAA
jgi:site-specific DNA-adenine methylase